MADNIAEIKKIFADNGVPLVRDDVWQVQSATVVKHKALERLAAALKIKWHPPQILRAERDEAVILVTGSIGDHMEWSIGEALIVGASGVGGNYKVSGKQASYVWAMAEKRGKDRVVLKLAGLDAFSEEESDDFRGKGEASSEPSSDELYMAHCLEKIRAFSTKEALADWWNAEKENRAHLLSKEQAAILVKETTARRDALTAKHDKPREAA